MFITLEGGEGAGKTTQQALLAERLQQEGYTCLCTREPGGTALGQELRALLLHGDPISPLAELLLYAADRAEHVQTRIHPALAAGQVVVCDRFTDSTLAYQGYGRGLDLDLIRQLNQLATGNLQPHLTLWLDLPPQVGLGRARSRQAAGFSKTETPQSSPVDRIEQAQLPFHQRLYQGFQELAATEPQRIVRIDAQGSPQEVAQRIWSVVKSRLAEYCAPQNLEGQRRG
ncbi:MAG: dTMP kinase [Cyanobacteriota bacterium]